MAEVVVEAEVFPSVLLHLAHRCPQVRKNAAALVRDVVKHSVELALYVVNMGGIGALIEALNQEGSGANCNIPCITALGYIAGDFSLIFQQLPLYLYLYLSSVYCNIKYSAVVY